MWILMRPQTFDLLKQYLYENAKINISQFRTLSWAVVYSLHSFEMLLLL